MPKERHLQPLLYFCCGFPLDVGVLIVLYFHLCSSVFYVIVTVANIVAGADAPGAGINPGTQAFNCAFALASFPFIACGVTGVRYHRETHLRMYLHWLLLTFSIDTACLFVDNIRYSCERSIPGFLAKHGGAFACGAMRIMNITTFIVFLGFAGYSVFTVWSKCEELEQGASAPTLDSLLYQARLDEAVILGQDRSGLLGTGPDALKNVPVVYGSLASIPYGGSTTIFDGKRHDLKFGVRETH